MQKMQVVFLSSAGLLHNEMDITHSNMTLKCEESIDICTILKCPYIGIIHLMRHNHLVLHLACAHLSASPGEES